MNSIFEKLSSYQILTNLFPGTFFGLGINFFFGFDVSSGSIGEKIVIYYFIGFIINRIGSLIVEPVLKSFCFIRYAPYPDFVKAAKVDSKIDILSETNNYIRSLLTCVLIFPAVRIFQVLSWKWSWFLVNWKWLAMAVLIALFLFSYKKQVNYIRKCVEVLNCLETKEKQLKEGTQ